MNPGDIDAILDSLNPAQREAVTTTGRPVLVLAGAGSGKTRTLTHRIAYLIGAERVPPWRILALTFTNKAAGEMRTRVAALLGDAQARDVWLGTFHSIGLRLLRTRCGLLGYDASFVVYDDHDQLALLKRILKDMRLDDGSTPRRVRHYIDHAKNEGWPPDDPRLPQETTFEAQAAQAYARYQEQLRAANAMDFGDLLLNLVLLLERHPEELEALRNRFAHVLVDEMQDTNAVQYRLLRLLGEPAAKVCVVGDDDQSIYSWRGARIDHILRFPEDFAGTHVVRLEQNYRSTANILAVASGLIAHNRRRHGKTLWTEADPGPPVQVVEAASDREEAEWVAHEIGRLRHHHRLDAMAVCYRTNAMSRPFEDALRAAGIPYRVVGGLRFYDRAEIKDLLAYLRILVNPADEVALVRIVNVPPRRIGAATVARILARARADQVPPVEALRALADEGGRGLAARVAPFRDLYDRLVAYAHEASPSAVAQAVLEWSGYAEMLRQEGSVEADARLENLAALLDSIREFEEAHGGSRVTLQDFLDTVSLTSQVDEADGPEQAVTLMTMHAAKGLEFDVVFVTGLDEGWMPHRNAIEVSGSAGLEEERRLLYVAVTRARRRLYLLRAQMRRQFGSLGYALPSRFLRELPPEPLATDGRLRSRLRATRRPTPPMGRASGAPGAGGDPVVVPTSDSGGKPGPGTAVRHPRYGRGTIRSIAGDGPDARVLVQFGMRLELLVARELVLDEAR